MKAILIIVIVGVLSAGVWGALVAYNAMTRVAPSFDTAEVKQGQIIASISATGTLEPEETVDVGAQVTGIIDKFGFDRDHPGKTVDFCSDVKQGDLLAHIYDVTYRADWETAEAQWNQAKSTVELAKANVDVADAKLHEAKNDWDRAQKTGPSEALSQSDYDMYQDNYESAVANKKVAEATVDADIQAVVQARNAADKAKWNLDFCTINSPVDGVVIARRVNIGQTVVSAMSAQSLFLLAKDLRKMVIWASVNEADVGTIHAGQTALFTVDAFPGDTFKGTVSRVRFDAQMTQNVVTYTVEVAVENPDLKLMPYMTANLNFQTQQHDNALIVPNSALRWEPSAQLIAPDAQHEAWVHGQKSALANASQGNSLSGPASASPSATTHPSPQTTHGTLWVQDGQYVRPIRVRVGVSDGTNSEVFGKDLKEGMKVIVNSQHDLNH